MKVKLKNMSKKEVAKYILKWWSKGAGVKRSVLKNCFDMMTPDERRYFENLRALNDSNYGGDLIENTR